MLVRKIDIRNKERYRELSFLNTIPNIKPGGILKTVMLATIEAVVRFTTSLAPKRIIKKHSS